MNEEQNFEVGDLVKLQSWTDYRPIESINYGYISFVDNSLLGDYKRIAWYNTDNHKFIKYVEKENEMQNTESNKDMQENKTEDTFKVGDTVWCLTLGKGSVVSTHYGCIYPIVVKFEDNNTGEKYTEDGKLYASGKRTLFFSEPKIEALTTRPFTPTLIGKSVLIIADHGIKYAFKVRDESTETLTDERNQKYYKDAIKELYILGENVVNSIK